MAKSRYTIFIDNLSSSTRSRDLREECERVAGRVLEVVRDPKSRSAIVEFDRSDDAEYAWKKLDRFYFDGREWKVDWATSSDFKYFDKQWTEGSSEKRGRSRSRSRSPHGAGTPRDAERPVRSPSAAHRGGGGGGDDSDRRRSPSPARD